MNDAQGGAKGARPVGHGRLPHAGRRGSLPRHPRPRARRPEPRPAGARAELLDDVLGHVARPHSPTGAARARALRDAARERRLPRATTASRRSGSTSTDADGVVYRFFAGSGLAFHPLANASRLNALVAAGSDDEARTLAAALAERAVAAADGATVWEYEFDFGERACSVDVGDGAGRDGAGARARRRRSTSRAARSRRSPARSTGAARRAVDPALQQRPPTLVLNAQLQSAISIADYADLDRRHRRRPRYAKRLLATAKTMLPRFDTGHWSRYSLGSGASRRSTTTTSSSSLLKLVRSADARPGLDGRGCSASSSTRREPPRADRPDGDAARLPACPRTACATS